MKRILSLALAAVLACSLASCGAKLTGISLPDTPLELATGETAQLEPSYTYDGATPENAKVDVTYASADESIATVSADGTVTALAEGETMVTATAGDWTAFQNVVVTIPVESLSLEPVSLHLDDDPVAPACTVVPENFSGTLTFTVVDESVARVQEDKVVPVAEGSTTLTITAPNGKTATAPVEVWSGPRSLTLTAAKTEVTKGSGTTITVTDENGEKVDAATLTWTSSDEKIATVSEGWVDLVGTGEVTITAATDHGVTASVTLTGTAPAASAPAASTPAAGNTTNNSNSASTDAPSNEPADSSAAAEAPATGSGHGYFYVTTDSGAFDLQNQVRAAAGSAALAWDDSLGSLACSRCEQIAVDFSHNGAQTGENIAVGYWDASSVMAAWQASPGHYANMISTSYTRGAIAHMYDGDGCHYWVAVFQ